MLHDFRIVSRCKILVYILALTKDETLTQCDKDTSPSVSSFRNNHKPLSYHNTSLVPSTLETVEIREQDDRAYEESIKGDGLHQPLELLFINRVVGARLDLVSAIHIRCDILVMICEK